MKISHLIIGILVVPTLLAIYYFLAQVGFYDLATRGQFGDTFGGANSLFSGLAFLGIIYTIFLQRKELSLQREELELTRKELKRTAEAQEKSEKALSKQAESLKITAKLNGLSSLLDFELAKPDTIKNLSNDNNLIFSFDVHRAEEIKSQIENIVNSK